MDGWGKGEMNGACDTPSGHGRVNLTTVDTTDVGSEVRVAGRWVEVCLRAFSAYMGGVGC
jgi:hypothetical protein